MNEKEVKPALRAFQIPDLRSQTGPTGLSDVRRQIVGDEQDGPAAKPNKADI